MESYKIYNSQYFSPGQPPIFVMSTEHHGKTGMHSHEFFEFVFIERGVTLHSYEGDTQILTTGDVFIILPGEAHSYISTNNTALYNLLFTIEALAGIEKHIEKLEGLQKLMSGKRDIVRLHGGLAEMQEMQVTLERMMWEQLNKPVGWELKVRSLFESLLVTYARLFGNRRAADNGGIANFNHIMKAVSFIESNYDKDVPLEDVAKESGLSTGYLSRQFKSVLGTSPSEYARNYRMAKAAELLRAEGNSVADVADKLGFSDISLFSRQFKQVTGVSPTGFRKNK